MKLKKSHTDSNNCFHKISADIDIFVINCVMSSHLINRDASQIRKFCSVCLVQKNISIESA